MKKICQFLNFLQRKLCFTKEINKHQKFLKDYNNLIENAKQKHNANNNQETEIIN